MKNREIIEELLGLDIKVKTSEGKERIIRFTNIEPRTANATLTLKDDDYYHLYHIELSIECFKYSMTIV